MEVPEKLLKFKVPILVGAIFCLFIGFIIYLAPSFLDILKYFWPLLVSTALFLVAIVVFGRISPPPPEASGEKAGEGILDYVAGQPEQLQPQMEEEEEEEEEEEGGGGGGGGGKGKGKAAAESHKLE